MSHAKHTPGYWNVEHPYGEPGVYVAGPNTGLIAKLYEPDRGMFNIDRPVSIEANARLIAAAPDLLKACEVALFALGECVVGREKLCDLFPVKVEALRAAIAKAEGK